MLGYDGTDAHSVFLNSTAEAHGLSVQELSTAWALALVCTCVHVCVRRAYAQVCARAGICADEQSWVQASHDTRTGTHAPACMDGGCASHTNAYTHPCSPSMGLCCLTTRRWTSSSLTDFTPLRVSRQTLLCGSRYVHARVGTHTWTGTNLPRCAEVASAWRVLHFQ